MWWVNEINDYSETYYPILLGVQRSFRENLTIPTWRWDIFDGTPLFGDPLAMLLNPVNWLSLFSDLQWFFPLAVIISFFIGVLGMRKMLKEFAIKENISNFFSVIFMILPMSIAHLKAGHLNIYEAISFYPWVIYYLKRWVVKKDIRYSIYLAITSVLVLFSHPGMFYILMFVIGSVSLYFVIKNKIRVRNYALFWVTLTGLGSIYILPTLELNQYINRTSFTKADIVPIWTMKSVIGGLFFPYPKINKIDQEAILYPGIIVGFLAIYGFLNLDKIKKIYVLLFLFLLLIISLGSFTPIYYLLIKQLPFEGVFRVSSRFWYLALITILVLSARGISKIKNRRIVFLIKSLLIIEFLSFAVLRLSLPGRYGIISNYSFYDRYFKNSINEFEIYSTQHSLSQRKIAEVSAGIADGEYPLQLKSYINDLQKAGGYDYSRYSIIQPPYQIYQDNPQPKADLLGQLNVLYIVSSYELTDPAFIKINKENGLTLYKNTLFKNFMWSEEKRINLFSYQNIGNRIKADFEVDRDTLVNLGIRNYPGWKIKVDGSYASLYPNNSWYQFSATAGRHTLEAKFDSRLYKAGLVLSLITFLITLSYLLLQIQRETQKILGEKRNKSSSYKKNN